MCHESEQAVYGMILICVESYAADTGKPQSMDITLPR